MCADTAKPNRSLATGNLLRPQNRLDIMLDADLLNGNADVRGSIILDITSDCVVVAQTDPPILRSATDHLVEATLVYHDYATYESGRWGWTSRILGTSNSYRLNPKDPASVLAQVVFLSLPPKDGLKKTNIRQAYRLAVGSGNDLIELELQPELPQMNLVDFSAGGFMVSTQAPPAYNLGQVVRFNLKFQDKALPDQVDLGGEATVVRLEMEPGAHLALIGLKYLDLDPNTDRDLQKVINYYMLEEQRKRNRDY